MTADFLQKHRVSGSDMIWLKSQILGFLTQSAGCHCSGCRGDSEIAATALLPVHHVQLWTTVTIYDLIWGYRIRDPDT